MIMFVNKVPDVTQVISKFDVQIIGSAILFHLFFIQMYINGMALYI